MAIGSCGLSANPSNEENNAFEKQIALANELGMPLIVKVDGCYESAWSILKNAGVPARGIMLRMPDVSAEQLTPWIEAGCYFTFGPRTVEDPAFFCNLAKALPGDRILIESGAPDNGIPPLSGLPPRCDQSVFIADVLQGICPTPQIVANTERFFS